MWPMIVGRRFDMIASGVSSKEGRSGASGRVRGSSDADTSSVESCLFVMVVPQSGWFTLLMKPGLVLHQHPELSHAHQ